MALINSTIYQLIALLFTFKLSFCLYEDQIGKFDWKKSHIGKLKFAQFDSVKRIVIATEENVLASLNLKNGQIVWRQLLESPTTHQIELLHLENTEALTVSGNSNNYHIRGWDLNAGTLLYEWSLTTEKTDARWIPSKSSLIHLVPVINSHIEVTTYQMNTGDNKGSTARISTPWVTDLNRCVMADTYFTCISSDNSKGQLYYIDLAGDLSKVQTRALSSLIGDTTGLVTIHTFEHSEPAVLIRRNNVNRMITIGENPSVLPNSFEKNLISVPNNGEANSLMQIELMPTNIDRPLQIKIIDLTEEKIIQLEPPYNKFGITLRTGTCRNSNCRVLVTNADNAISLLQLPAGKVVWSREEALSQVVAAEFIELPLSELDASIEREFNEASNDMFSMFTRRIVSQIRQLTTFIAGNPTSINDILVRDNFGLHKLIILATKVGKLFAIDTISGDIIWSKFLANLAPYQITGRESMFLYQQRTARYSPTSAEMMLIAKDSATGLAALYKFDPISGQALSGIEILGFKIKQAMLLPYEDKNHIKGLILLDSDEQLHVYPPSAKSTLHKYAATTYLFNADTENSVLNGYTLIYGSEENPKVTPTWTLNLMGSKIVALSMRPSIERVHSQGRVLADRSVFYKYVNPNLIALATIADDVMHKHVLSVYLLDGVTGLVVYSAHHKRANGPVNMIHSENWIVYSYFSERFRRYEMTAVELYEGARQSNSTAFSSHALSQLPHPETLSYILPVNPLTMVATLTERGITNKHLLIGLSSGAVIEVPWAFLEPRGSHLPSNPEEGYIPYMPELPIHSETMINYNQSLPRIRGIQVSPARLESTSLVIIYGLDLFYTRVMPSKTFDVLKEDFDHWLIVMVLVGLTLASYATKRLSIRKALKQQWK